MMQVLGVLGLAASIVGLPFHSTFSFSPEYFYRPLPDYKTYYKPLYLPNYDVSLPPTFDQPPIPSFFPDHTHNTTENKETTSKPEESEINLNKTDNVFDALFKKSPLPSFDYFNKGPIIVPDLPAYPQFEEKIIMQSPSPSDTFYHQLGSINQAYGLPGFRPFYYDDFLRKLNSTNCTSPPCYEDLAPFIKEDKEDPETASKGEKIKADIKEIIDRVYKPAPGIVFNTKTVPMKTDADLDVRLGRNKASVHQDKQLKLEDPFSQAYKDIDFISKSFLSTVAPYLH